MSILMINLTCLLRVCVSSFLLFFPSIAFAFPPCKVAIFDCGQGNAIIAKYNKQTMVFDAGRSTSSKFYGHENDEADESLVKQNYTIEDSPTEDPLFGSGMQTLHIEALEGDDKELYDSYFKKRFIKFAQKNKKLKAVFISHPDEDHYNLIAPFSLTPQRFILGGKFDSYNKNKEFIEFLHSSGSVLSYINDNADPLNMFQNGANAIAFEGENPPEVKILSANAGSKRGINSKNQDSMIVKIKQKWSILLTGDAQKLTWEDAINTNGGELASDILLISHHGSRTKESTTPQILEAINPKVCFITAGFHYNHPHWEVVNLLLEYYKNRPYKTKAHFLTYYNKDEKLFRSIITNAPVFSTIDQGRLSVDLSSEDLSVNVSRDYDPAPTVFLDGDDSEGETWGRYYNWEPNRTFYTFSELKDLNNAEDPKDEGDQIYSIGSEEEIEKYFKYGDSYLKLTETDEPA